MSGNERIDGDGNDPIPMGKNPTYLYTFALFHHN